MFTRPFQVDVFILRYFRKTLSKFWRLPRILIEEVTDFVISFSKNIAFVILIEQSDDARNSYFVFWIRMCLLIFKEIFVDNIVCICDSWCYVFLDWKLLTIPFWDIHENRRIVYNCFEYLSLFFTSRLFYWIYKCFLLSIFDNDAPVR